MNEIWWPTKLKVVWAMFFPFVAMMSCSGFLSKFGLKLNLTYFIFILLMVCDIKLFDS